MIWSLARHRDRSTGQRFRTGRSKSPTHRDLEWFLPVEGKHKACGERYGRAVTHRVSKNPLQRSDGGEHPKSEGAGDDVNPRGKLEVGSVGGPNGGLVLREGAVKLTADLARGERGTTEDFRM
jgi:hypothetical protein